MVGSKDALNLSIYNEATRLDKRTFHHFLVPSVFQGEASQGCGITRSRNAFHFSVLFVFFSLLLTIHILLLT